MTLVADSHAIFWYLQRSPRLSPRAAEALQVAEASDGITVSAATIADLWYVTQTTQAITIDDLARIRATLDASPRISVQPLDLEIAGAYTKIPRSMLTDPWDRFIVATANVLSMPLVTRDRAIHQAKLVETVW